jgi:hypothetical protein
MTDYFEHCIQSSGSIKQSISSSDTIISRQSLRHGVKQQKLIHHKINVPSEEFEYMKQKVVSTSHRCI